MVYHGRSRISLNILLCFIAFTHHTTRYSDVNGFTYSKYFNTVFTRELKEQDQRHNICGLASKPLYTHDEGQEEIETEGEDLFQKYPKRIISASVSKTLPFSSSVAFDAFSNLTRQPSWSPWLHSVVYLEDGVTTKWTLKIKGVSYSWEAISTRVERPNIIQWESISGIRNQGVVQFKDLDKTDSEEGEASSSCEMVITMRFIMPRLLRKLGSVGFIKRFFEQKMLGGMLLGFQDVVLEEDLGIKVSKEHEKDLFDETELSVFSE